MYDNVITGKENSFKEWNFIISMFLTSFKVYFVLRYACFMCIHLKIGIWLFLGQGLAFFGEDGLAILVRTVTLPNLLLFRWCTCLLVLFRLLLIALALIDDDKFMSVYGYTLFYYYYDLSSCTTTCVTVELQL